MADSKDNYIGSDLAGNDSTNMVLTKKKGLEEDKDNQQRIKRRNYKFPMQIIYGGY